MGFKELSAWLKGGVIGIIIFFVLVIPLLICAFSCSSEGCIGCLIFSLPLIFGSIFSWFDIINIENDILGYIVIAIINIPLYFLIGALIGWIVGKIRNRNKKPMSNY